MKFGFVYLQSGHVAVKLVAKFGFVYIQSGQFAVKLVAKFGFVYIQSGHFAVNSLRNLDLYIYRAVISQLIRCEIWICIYTERSFRS